MSLEYIYNEPLVLLSFVLINCFLMNGSEGRRLPRKSKGHGHLMGVSKSCRTLAVRPHCQDPLPAQPCTAQGGAALLRAPRQS